MGTPSPNYVSHYLFNSALFVFHYLFNIYSMRMNHAIVITRRHSRQSREGYGIYLMVSGSMQSR